MIFVAIACITILIAFGGIAVCVAWFLHDLEEKEERLFEDEVE